MKMFGTEIYSRVCFTIFRMVEIIFTILGLAPCSINMTPQTFKKLVFYTFSLSHSRLKCAYNISLIIFFFLIIVFAVPHMSELSYPNNSKTVMTIVIIRAVTGNLFAITIIIFYSVLQGHIINIGNRLSEFDRKYGSKLFGMRSSKSGDIQKFVTIILMLFIWIGLVTVAMIIISRLFIVTSGLCTGVLGWFLIQYSLIINLLSDRFEGLNNAFLAMSRCPILINDNSIFSGRSANDRSNLDNFLVIKRARNVLYQISRQVATFYSLPVFIAVSYSCCSCVESTYFLIMTLVHFEVSFWSLDTLNSLFWITTCVYPVVMLSASVNTFYGETHRTIDNVYEIMETHASNKNTRSELNNFAIELSLKRVQFTACGVFSLDCSLLHSIFGMIVTYLLILLQFKPSEG